MELRHLRSFSAVAAEEHFRRAAEKLNVAQPALSQQVRQLEEELGVTLFERVGRGVRLTEAGSLFWDYADRIIALVEESAEAAREHEGLTRGRLRLGIAQTPNSFHAPKIVSSFKKKHPKVFVSVAELAAAEIEAQLLKGELDLGVGFAPCDSPQLSAEPLFEERFVLVVPKGHALHGRSKIALKTLQSVELALLTRDFCTRRLFENTCDEFHIELSVSIEMNTIEGILASLADTGLGTVLPEQVVRSPLMNVKLKALPIEQPGIRRQVALVYRKTGFLTAAARAMAAEWRAATVNPKN